MTTRAKKTRHADGQAYSTPGPIPEDALRYFEAKRLEPAWSYLDVWREEHSISFTVAKVMELDILESVRVATREALAEGKTFEKWRKEVEPQLNKSGWADFHPPALASLPPEWERLQRLRTIFETNMRQARQAGVWDRVQRTKEVLPYLEYALGPSARHRPEHVDWAGTILPVDDPWWSEHYPINGWGCKCYVVQVGRAEVEKRGGPDVSPPVVRHWFKNYRTKEMEMVPKGIDPGFNYNVGEDRLGWMGGRMTMLPRP